MQVNSHMPVTNQAAWIWCHTSFTVSPGSRELSCVCFWQFVAVITPLQAHCTAQPGTQAEWAIPWDGQRVWPFLWGNHWESHARAKQSLQMHLAQQRCLDPITHNLAHQQHWLCRGEDLMYQNVLMNRLDYQLNFSLAGFPSGNSLRWFCDTWLAFYFLFHVPLKKLHLSCNPYK